MKPEVVFEPVAPVDLHAAWLEAARELYKLHARRHTDWWPEDVYAAVKQGTAYLFRGLVRYQPNGTVIVGGFVVLVPQTNLYTNRKSLLVWITTIFPGFKGLLQPGLQALKELARRGGYESLTFFSSRHGWRRYAAGMGATVGDTQFTVEV